MRGHVEEDRQGQAGIDCHAFFDFVFVAVSPFLVLFFDPFFFSGISARGVIGEATLAGFISSAFFRLSVFYQDSSSSPCTQ